MEESIEHHEEGGTDWGEGNLIITFHVFEGVTLKNAFELLNGPGADDEESDGRGDDQREEG